MEKNPPVSIIIRTANRLDKLKDCINSLLNIDYPDFNIVIAMDESKDGTREYLEKTYNTDNRFILVYNKKHKSSAYMYNLGIKYSTGEMIVFIDDDCIADKNCIRELVSSFLEDPGVCCVGGAYYKPGREKIVNTYWLSGCILGFKRSLFKKLSFDENLKYSHWYDESDLISRLERANYKLKLNHKAFVIHFRDEQSRAKQKRFGPLNMIYSQVKFTPLIKYYLSVLTYLLLKKIQGFSLEFDFPSAINSLNISSLSGIKKIWIIYVLLLEIPIKAKIKYRRREPVLR